MSTTLTKGESYDLDTLIPTGWTEGDGTGHEGYHVADYFRDGVYLGPDEHGIEPEFESAITYSIIDGGTDSAADLWQGCPEFFGSTKEIADQAEEYAKRNATETDSVTVRVFKNDTCAIIRTIEIEQDDEEEAERGAE